MATHHSGNGWPAILGQVPGNWMDGYKALASASQTIADHWIKNRTAQVERDLAAWTRLTSCKDSHEVAEIQKRWWEETLAGLTAEAKDYQEQVAGLAQQSLAGLGDDKAARQPKA